MPNSDDNIQTSTNEFSSLETSFSGSDYPNPSKVDSYQLIYNSTEAGKLSPSRAVMLLICMNTGQVAVLLLIAFSGVAICLISTMPQDSPCPIKLDTSNGAYHALVWKLGSLFVSVGIACLFWVMMNRFIHPGSVFLGKTNPFTENPNDSKQSNSSTQTPSIPFNATGVIALFLLIFFLIGFNVKIG